MADDLTYTSTSPAGLPDLTKQVTDEEGGGRGHMPVIKLAYSADGVATLVAADANGLRINVAPAATATLSNVSGSASSVTVLASNTARLGASVFNDSTSAVYLKYGASASTSSFSAKLDPGGYFECPFHYTGLIAGIWDSATGAARVTELTA